MKTCRSFLPVFLLALPCGSSAAGTPEEVAHTYIRAMADQRLNVVADVMHTGALQRFKDLLVQIASGIEALPADRRPPERMVNALFGDDGLGAVKEGEPRDVFVQFMSNLTTFVPQIREMTAGSEYQVLGHVDEGGNVAHVVFRATLRRGETAITKMEVLSLKREGENWRILLTDDLSSLVAGLGRQLTAPPARPRPIDPPVGQ